MARTMVTGLFRSRAEAECAFGAASELGYSQADVNLVMTDESRKRWFPANRSVDTELGDKVSGDAGQAAQGGRLGGPVGGTVGTLAPVVAAISVLTVLPGLGLVAAGPLAAAAAAAAAVAVAGGLMGALTDWGIPKERIEQYEAGIRDGGILMGLKPRSEDDAQHLVRKWQACGAVHVHS
jgi:hypothetical protein